MKTAPVSPSSLLLLLPLVALLSPASGYNTRGAAASHNHHPLENMNGDYILSSTPGAHQTEHLFPTQFKNYPDQDFVPVESFDVYSPLISQLYSQVFWKGLPPVSLPKHIVDKYQSKVMAVVGFEVDQVRLNENQQEESLPITAAYNHHFESTMIGGNARFELASPDDPRLVELHATMGHKLPPHQPYWMVVGDELTATGKPTQQAFGGANGGEFRKSFHGYAPGFAQLIESPREIQITPMQIDTWHRDAMNISDPIFVPGPLPRNSLAPPDAQYSGLLECPVTTRIKKNMPQKSFVPQTTGFCPDRISDKKTCLQAVSELIQQTDSSSKIELSVAGDGSSPPGCSMRVTSLPSIGEKTKKRVVQAYFNNNTHSHVECGSKDDKATTLFSAVATSFVNVSVVMDTTKDEVSITLTGPSEVWFGVGFGAQAMKNNPWTIIVDGYGNVTERNLADHAPGNKLQPSVEIVSSQVDEENSRRMVTVTRPLQGQYFTFSTGAIDIPFINAIGSSPELSYHANKEPHTMLVLPVHESSDATDSGSGGVTCLCRKGEPPFGAGKGTLEYVPVDGQPGEKGQPGKVVFDNSCAPSPYGVLLDQKNPTCDIRTYTGGQLACHHGWSLLDADQGIPWPDQPLEYKLKFRFWVQPYNATYHRAVHRTTWGIASPVEYDVPKCSEGMEGCSKQIKEDGTERWVHTIHGLFHVGENSGSLVAAHFHCHAPTCLSMELYLCETEAGCDETTGKLLCREETVWGSGDTNTNRFDEHGFILQPPCLWGSPEVGLEPPLDVRNKTLFARKTADANHGHHGEMAWMQMYYA